MWDELDSYHFMIGMPLRPRWRDAPYLAWFAWRPVKVSGSWVWLRQIERRRRRAHRWSFTPFGGYRATTVDYRLPVISDLAGPQNEART